MDELYGEESKRKSKVDRKTYYFEEQPKADALIKLIRSKEFNSNTDTDNRTNLNERSKSSSGSECRSLDSSGNFESSASVESSRENTEGFSESSSTYKSSDITTEYTGGHAISQRSDSILSKSSIDNPLDKSPPAGRKALCSTSRVSSRCTSDIPTPSRRAIIWYNMAAELAILERTLTENRISYITIAGGDKDIGGKVHRFNKDPSIGFLLCQAKTINYGVTIMGSEKDEGNDILPEFDSIVSDQIFYSLNFSLEVFLQQQDRIHRIGQRRKCRYWMLLTNSPIERRIADRLEEKLLCNKEILIDISKNLDLKGI